MVERLHTNCRLDSIFAYCSACKVELIRHSKHSPEPCHKNEKVFQLNFHCIDRSTHRAREMNSWSSKKKTVFCSYEWNHKTLEVCLYDFLFYLYTYKCVYTECVPTTERRKCQVSTWSKQFLISVISTNLNWIRFPLKSSGPSC